MKKWITLFSVAIISTVQAQGGSNRFFYELTYKPHKDSARLEKEMMILDTDQKQSVYQAYDIIVMDSISDAMIKQAETSGRMPDFKTIPDKKTLSFSHRIFKYYPIHEILYKDRIFNDYYSYREDPGIQWKVSDEKQKIGSYMTQKAETDFGGRKWIAWFTTDIPIQDGPFKFYGLPGLIVKIEDTGKNYSWELKGNKKIDEIKDILLLEKISKKAMSENIRELSKEKFTEKYETYRKDPLVQMRQMASRLPQDTQLPNGDSLSEAMREAEKKAKEQNLRNNNSIEMSRQEK